MSPGSCSDTAIAKLAGQRGWRRPSKPSFHRCLSARLRPREFFTLRWCADAPRMAVSPSLCRRRARPVADGRMSSLQAYPPMKVHGSGAVPVRFRVQVPLRLPMQFPVSSPTHSPMRRHPFWLHPFTLREDDDS